MELEGKVAAVTGGTRGIGRAIAEAFVREGAKVVINGRNEEKGQQALKEMDAGDAAVFVAGDAKQREDCERVVDTTVEKFGRIDIMVNNAGGAGNHAPVVDLTDEAFDDALRWILWSTFWCTRRSLQHMIPQKWGRIINVSSLEGKCGKPGVSIYVTAKHAINGLTKSCAQEVGTLGITVNALCPGGIETDIMADEGPKAAELMGMTYQEFLNWYAKESATKRLCEVDDVAAVAVLLASDAGAGISGSLISIDGGTAPY
jgi:3-hydroxybutyrate dehydrogenase